MLNTRDENTLGLNVGVHTCSPTTRRRCACRWIGIIERILVATFVLIGNLNAKGFLLAAKSVLRFGDLRNARDKGQTEYRPIGTLLSFGLTISTGVLVCEIADF